jgi:hypothetical protein
VLGRSLVSRAVEAMLGHSSGSRAHRLLRLHCRLGASGDVAACTVDGLLSGSSDAGSRTVHGRLGWRRNRLGSSSAALVRRLGRDGRRHLGVGLGLAAGSSPRTVKGRRSAHNSSSGGSSQRSHAADVTLVRRPRAVQRGEAFMRVLVLSARAVGLLLLLLARRDGESGGGSGSGSSSGGDVASRPGLHCLAASCAMERSSSGGDVSRLAGSASRAVDTRSSSLWHGGSVGRLDGSIARR